MTELNIIEILVMLGFGGALWHRIGKLEGILTNGLQKRIDEICKRIKALEDIIK